MGTSASERIAIGIETTANVSGVREARGETAALTQEAARLGETSTKTAISLEQARAAVVRSGGDSAKLEQELRKLAAGEDALAPKAEKAGAALDREAQKMGKLESAAYALDAARTKAAASEDQQRGKSEAAAYAEDAARTKQGQSLDRVSGSARTAANGLGILTQAVLIGNGSLAGMASAAGGVATGLSRISNNARLAAGAAGIGALVTVGVLLYEVYEKAKGAIGGTVSELARAHIGNDTLPEVIKELELQKGAIERAQSKAAASATGTILDIIPSTQAYKDQKALEDAAAKRELLEKRKADLESAELRRQSELRRSVQDQIADNTRLIALAQYKGAIDKETGQRKNSDFAIAKEQVAVEERARNAEIEREFRHADAKGNLVALTAEESALKSKLIAQSGALADAQTKEINRQHDLALALGDANRQAASDNYFEAIRGRLALIEIQRQAEIDSMGDVVSATENAELKKRALYKETFGTIADSIIQIAQGSAQASESLAVALKKTALSPLVSYLQGLAKKELVEAGINALVGNFIGAGKHAAGAALALAGAHEVAQIGGLSGGGGGGGSVSGGGGGASGGTYEPRSVNTGGNVTVVIQTVDPTSRAVTDITSYQLQRAGALKRPIYAPSGQGAYPAVGLA